MTDVRRDPVNGRLVIMAARRAGRPYTLVGAHNDESHDQWQCPFCAGNERMTPPEIDRIDADGPGESSWRSRVFPNLYPVTPHHEVVVLSPSHDRSFAQLSDEHAAEVMSVLRDRVKAHLRELPYSVAFVNHGRAAGASIAHPHAQVVGLPFVPPEVQATQQRQETAEGDLVDHDVKLAREHDLLVDDDGSTPLWCPFASGAPFQIRVVHRDAGPRFDQASDDVIAAVARATRRALVRVRETLQDPPYNMVIHTADANSSAWPRWHVEMTPRLSIQAGFEQATGVLVNTTPPETATPELRSS
jgi:UDPglucose--hexose-1-phosphate uridylyltransferase